MILDRIDRLGIRERFGIGFAAVALFLWGLDAVVVTPLMRKSADVRAEVERQSERLVYCRAVVNEAAATTAAYEKVRDLVGKASSSDEASGQMIGEVDELATQSGVMLTRRQSRNPRKFSYCEEHVLEISEFSASISQLLSFLYYVQDSPGMLRVTRLKVAPEKGSPVLKGSMEITKVVAPAAPGKLES